MSGPGEGKKELKDLKIYLHEKGKSGARVMHIDIEGDSISKIIEEGEISFVKGKSGGIFIALKKEMIKRAEKLITK